MFCLGLLGMQLHFVLDTNVFRSISTDDLRRLASIGLPIRLSDVALAEAWEFSVTAHDRGEDRRRARGYFFRPIQRVLPFLEMSAPLAPVAGVCLATVRADLAGEPLPDDYQVQMRGGAQFLRRAAAPELTDEEWIEGGREMATWLDRADAQWKNYCLQEHEIWERRWNDPEERERARQDWATIPLEVRRRDLIAILRDYLAFDDQLSERFEAYLRVFAWRLLNASHRFGVARRNDGGDNILPHHLEISPEGVDRVS